MSHMFRSLRVHVLLLIVATATCAAQPPQSEPSEPAHSSIHAFARKRKVNGIKNFGEVTPTLFRGAQPTHEGFKTLASMGIDIVVDARHHGDDPEGKEVRQLGMQYLAIPWQCPSPNDDVFVRFLKLLEVNPNKRVFLHCRLGEDRTGMMVAAYRMAVEGWTADQAMREMQYFGFSKVHHALCPGLAPYEKMFPEHLEINPALAHLRRAAQDSPK